MIVWNPWHGCHKISPGCANCYVYRRDESIGKDASVVTKTGDYDLPLKKNRQGQYKLSAEDGIVFTCMTSDFFLEDADEWRQGCWDMIRERQDLQFHIITKRIDRFAQCIPSDWSDGWEHVTICSTCENQKMADYRLPIFLKLPIKHREVISEPILNYRRCSHSVYDSYMLQKNYSKCCNESIFHILPHYNDSKLLSNGC